MPKPAAPQLTMEQLEAYGAAITKNAESLVDDGEVLLKAKRFARSYALCTLAIEESHKLPIVWKLMMELLTGEAPDWKALTSAATSHIHKLTMAVASTAAIPQVTTLGAPALEPAALQNFLTDSRPFVKEFNDRKLLALYADIDANGDAVLPESTVDETLATTMVKTARATVGSMAAIQTHARTVLQQLAAAGPGAGGATVPSA